MAGSCFGRARAISELLALVDGERLVTLSGPPGVGKTRLAREVAARRREVAQVVELAPVRDRPGVTRAIASALGVQEVPGRGLTDVIAERLRARPALLVLDNCEHLLDACAEAADALLGDCPRLRVLATSRQPLRAGGELVWQVPPLAVPSPADDGADPGELLRFDAVALFVERAAAAQRGFELNRYVAAHVAEICRRLDGLPLAIELAAARVQALTPGEIAARLDEQRVQALQAAIDWSHALLSPAERALLARLAVFNGAFGLDAAEAVCGGGVVAAGDVGALLDELTAKSLVVSEPHGDRHRLLETVRAYARERLERAGEAGRFKEAHARHHRALAELAEPCLVGSTQQQWFAELEVRRADLLAALDWCLSNGRGEWGLRMGGALVVFWRVRGHFGEGRDLLQAALAAGRDEAPGLRAKALWGAGFLGVMAGDGDSATALVEQSLALFEQLGEAGGQARALLVLGNARQGRGDPAAQLLLDRSIELARAAGDSWCLAHALACAGAEQCFTGTPTRGRLLLEEGVAVARLAEDGHGVHFALVALGQAALLQGDAVAARAALEESAAVAGDLGATYARASALVHLGEAALGTGELARAGELLDEAIVLMRDARPQELVNPLACRALLARTVGDRELARALLDEAVGLARDGARPAAPALIGMAQVRADEGDPRAAARLFEEALDDALAAGDTRGAAVALSGLAELARAAGEAKRASMLYADALTLQRRDGHVRGIVVSLEAIGALALEAGRAERAVRLLAAAGALRDAHCAPRAPAHAARLEADLESARGVLAPAAFDAAVRRGLALSLEQAATDAVNGHGHVAQATGGWSSLTSGERQIAALVADGLTNREISERLYISIGTVKDYLARIFPKVGVATRAALAREVGRREQQPVDAAGSS